ncbi:MAG TPA: PLP-dependent aminotransferase family protein [Planctomycetaceae bacterium]|nr:PLP-dependent aminotransferase family protein [Planctomycetaceae bacterium]
MKIDTVSARFSSRADWASRGAISFLMQQGVENPGVLSLAAGLVDPSTLPVEETRHAFQQLLADDTRAREALQYGTTQGSETLRQALVPFFSRLEGRSPDDLNITRDDFFLTTGSQQLLSLTCELLFDPGDICLVAAPTYFVFLGALQGVGARAIPVATDSDGMCPDALERKLAELEANGELERVKLIYLVSYYDNPSGISLSTERRSRMVEIAEKWSKSQRIFILEDAAYRELQYDGEVFPSLWSFDDERETVIYTQTFSKSYAPGVRVGFGIVPEVLAKPLNDRKGNEDFGSAHLNQRLIATILQGNEYSSHVERVKESYRTKRDAMLAAAEKYFSGLKGVRWEHPHGGLYVWMSLPEQIATGFASRLFEEAVKQHGVMYVPGELSYAPEHAEQNHMRLSFGVLPAEKITEGMRRLSEAVKSLL